MSSDSPEPVLVQTTHPPDGAESFASRLVERRLVACAQLVTGVTSVYRWKDAVECEPEVRLDLKTSRDRLSELEAAILELHPYDTPEIVVLPIEGGSAAYLDWVHDMTRPAD